MRALAAALALALSGCATSSLLPADPGAPFDPVTFFTGRTEGAGKLHIVLKADRRISVQSIGRPDGRGGLILDQTIREGSDGPRQRRWVMRPAGPNRFTGSLTEALGPVQIAVDGPRATIRYTMTGGFEVEQQLALQRDRRTLLNQLIVRKVGIPVARLDETIRKLP